MDINNIQHILHEINNVYASFLGPSPEDPTIKSFKSDIYYGFHGINKSDIEDIFTQTFPTVSFPYQLGPYEWSAILASTLPIYYPDAYKGISFLRDYSEGLFAPLGGKTIGDNKAIYPTGETILFLLAGHNLEKRVKIERIFRQDSILFVQNMLRLTPHHDGTSRLSGQIYPSKELLAILNNEVFVPGYNHDFPATKIETYQSWDDLVLDYDTYESLDEMMAWLDHHQPLQELSIVSTKFKRGYRALFYGPPGTGKTFTASLFGKKYGMDVYRVDLSMVVSKWVGETEKNLKNIFDLAENKHWILVFDEADALFGKRTQNSSANDRYANQEIAYLLQRIEDFPGLVVLASNLKANMDKAFTRRFQSMVYFPMPGEIERKILWEKAFSAEINLGPAIDIRDIAKKYELSGGSITNVLRYCCLMALNRGSNIVQKDELERGIKRELAKEGKLA